MTIELFGPVGEIDALFRHLSSHPLYHHLQTIPEEDEVEVLLNTLRSELTVRVNFLGRGGCSAAEADELLRALQAAVEGSSVVLL